MRPAGFGWVCDKTADASGRHPDGTVCTIPSCPAGTSGSAPAASSTCKQGAWSNYTLSCLAGMLRLCIIMPAASVHIGVSRALAYATACVVQDLPSLPSSLPPASFRPDSCNATAFPASSGWVCNATACRLPCPAGSSGQGAGSSCTAGAWTLFAHSCVRGEYLLFDPTPAC